MTVICAEAPIALLVEPWGVVPLTPCCQACASIDDEGVHYCKGCYEEVDWWFGDSWKIDTASGWDQYRAKLVELEGVTPGRAAEIAGYAEAKAAAL